MINTIYPPIFLWNRCIYSMQFHRKTGWKKRAQIQINTNLLKMEHSGAMRDMKTPPLIALQFFREIVASKQFHRKTWWKKRAQI